MATDPDTLDPDKLPNGAIRQIDGRIVFNESIYSKEGKREGALIDAMNDPKQAIDTLNTAARGTWLEPVLEVLPRAGLVVLGAALCIVGIVMLISGTRAAELTKSLIPVAGKVL